MVQDEKATGAPPKVPAYATAGVGALVTGLLYAAVQVPFHYYPVAPHASVPGLNALSTRYVSC